MALSVGKPLDDAIEKVRALRGLPDNRLSDAQEHCWELLQPAIKACKGKRESLDSVPEEAVWDLVDFLLLRAVKKRVLKGKVGECLQIALTSDEWLRGVHSNSGTMSALQQFFAENAGMRAKLHAPPPPREPPSEPEPVPLTMPQGDGRDARSHLLNGVRAMQAFSWKFPPVGTGTAQRDTATEAFNSLNTGVTRLACVSDRLAADVAVEDYFGNVLNELDNFWPDVVAFLASMNEERKPFRERIRFVVTKLSLFSCSFRSAVVPVDIWGITSSADMCAAVQKRSNEQ